MLWILGLIELESFMYVAIFFYNWNSYFHMYVSFVSFVSLIILAFIKSCDVSILFVK